MIAFPLFSRILLNEAVTSEADALAEIHGEAFARTWSGEDFATLLAQRSTFALAVRRENIFGSRRMVGFVLVRVAADEAEILTIAVRRDSRGRGYGRMLMEEALRRLYRDRIATCFLEVNRSNDAAVRLYRSLGFVVAAERARYYSEATAGDTSALVMRLQLR
jgi:[ribosomal protein S18]-alanine N-acetyltransferase